MTNPTIRIEDDSGNLMWMLSNTLTEILSNQDEKQSTAILKYVTMTVERFIAFIQASLIEQAVGGSGFENLELINNHIVDICKESIERCKKRKKEGGNG